MPEQPTQTERHDRLVRQYAQRTISVAADACAAALALRFAPPSRKHNHRQYRLELERRFRAVVDEVGAGWDSDDEAGSRDGG